MFKLVQTCLKLFLFWFRFFNSKFVYFQSELVNTMSWMKMKRMIMPTVESLVLSLMSTLIRYILLTYMIWKYFINMSELVQTCLKLFKLVWNVLDENQKHDHANFAKLKNSDYWNILHSKYIQWKYNETNALLALIKYW